MARSIRWTFLALVLVVGLAFAPAQAADFTEGTQESGALYQICVPNLWNDDLVVYAHGYVSPLDDLKIPDDKINGTPISQIVTGLGYAFATTSYSKNGLAVLEGLEDLADLVGIFKSRYPQFNGYVYLVGVSEGGLIAALAAEQYPEVFDGVMSCCGPVGDFRKQINHWGDVRVIFDYFFPGVLPGSPINISAEVMNDWDDIYEPQIRDALAVDPSAADQLLKVTKVATDPGNPSTQADAIVGNLWYNVFATNDGIEELHGQPFDNKWRWYSGSDNDLRLNRKVRRFRADRAALTEIAKYQTSGRLEIPLVTLHNLGDPIVPYWHEILYGIKILTEGSILNYTHIPINRWGHCEFTKAEVLAAFAILNWKVEGLPLTGAQAALPTTEAQLTFQQLLDNYGGDR